MQDHMISVLIPVFNASSYLEERSINILSQSFKNIEYIFIDDCSQDDTWQVLQNIKSNNPELDIKIYRNEQNLGPAPTRNKALSLSTGKYIYFADADDICDTHLVEKALSTLEHDQSDLVFLAYQVVNNDERANFYFDKAIIKNANSIEELRKFSLRLPFSPWAKVVKRNFLVENNIVFPNLHFGEDMCWTMKIMQHAQKISFINECLYQYVITEGSLTSGKYACEMFDYYKVAQNTFKEFNNSQYLLDQLFHHIMDVYVHFFYKSDNEQQKKLAKLFFSLPEAQDLYKKFNEAPIHVKLPFYKLLPIKTFRRSLKDRHKAYKSLKIAMNTRNVLQ